MKTEISLVDILAFKGWSLDDRSSTPTSKVLRRGDDKITVARARDQNWVWVSRMGSGSVLDYLKTYEGLNLGLCRIELRPWLVGQISAPENIQRVSQSIKPTSADLMSVQFAYSGMTPITDGVHPYLNDHRGLTPSLLSLPHFQGKLRRDDQHYGNAVFPHYDREGLSGYVAINQSHKSFAAGGRKGLFGTTPGASDACLVIAEGVIDGAAYLQQHGHQGVRVVSFEGTMNTTQPELIASAIEKLPQGEIIAAVDNDAGGDKFDEKLREIHAASKRSDLIFRRHSPHHRSMDWGDIVMGRRPPTRSLSR